VVAIPTTRYCSVVEHIPVVIFVSSQVDSLMFMRSLVFPGEELCCNIGIGFTNFSYPLESVWLLLQKSWESFLKLWSQGAFTKMLHVQASRCHLTNKITFLRKATRLSLIKSNHCHKQRYSGILYMNMYLSKECQKMKRKPHEFFCPFWAKFSFGSLMCHFWETSLLWGYCKKRACWGCHFEHMAGRYFIAPYICGALGELLTRDVYSQNGSYRRWSWTIKEQQCI